MKTVIDCRNVGKIWPGRPTGFLGWRTSEPVAALDGFSLKVMEGEFVSILGPSGCGKSTLLNILTGLETLTTGEILLEDRPVMVFQQPSLFPWRKVEDNVGLPLEILHVAKRVRGPLVEGIIREVGLYDFRDSYPHQLSGGMQQRAAIARTFAAQSRIVLMDEPFGALDAMTRREMWSWLAGLWLKHRQTIVMVTHDVEEVIALSDRVVITTSRPAKSREEMPVTLPRPRDLSSAEFFQLKNQILQTLTS